MDTFLSILVVIGLCYGAYRGVRWMLRAGQVQASNNPPLSPRDLKVLEESAARLMADLRTVTDECVARIESACADAARLTGSMERTESIDHSSVVAGLAGLTTGEVELLRGLKAIETKSAHYSS
ncbi:MAG: hypothetical protein ACYC64_12800 [Armatimonadota bacterium]